MNVDTGIKLPIFIKDGDDLLIFDTIVDAALYIEPVDVLAGSYTGYDSLGRLLNIKVQPDRDRRAVELVPSETQPTHQEELREVLIAYLHVLGVRESSIVQSSLDDLVNKALPYKQHSVSLLPNWKWLRWLGRK